MSLLISVRFRPNSDRVLVKIEAVPEKRGSLYVPETARATSDDARYGIIVAVGDGRRIEGGFFDLFSDAHLHVGDRVLIDSVGGLKVKIDGEEFLLVRFEEILGFFV